MLQQAVDLHVSKPHTYSFALCCLGSGAYNADALDAEDGGYVYRYQYNGMGEATTWLSSKNYLVLDVSAGPSTYGPAISRSGGVTQGAVPSVRVRQAE